MGDDRSLSEWKWSRRCIEADARWCAPKERHG
jgi:hypothetical protein